MTRKLIAATAKELLLLKRDRTGLLVLFLMPAILVIVITLVQENVMELTGQKKTELLLLDLDDGELGVALRRSLTAHGFDVVAWDRRQKSGADPSTSQIADLRAAIAGGDYRLGVILLPGASGQMEQGTALSMATGNRLQQADPAGQVAVPLYFDPGIMPGFRSGLTAQLQAALETVALEAKLKNLDRELRGLLDRLGVAKELAPLPADGFTELLGRPVFVLDESHTGAGPAAPPYRPVQQNVPAWALFGMFFTAIPIAGALLQERKSGIWSRLASLPVSPLLLFAGKVAAYVLVCLCQFLLIGLIGALLFPYLGLPAFTVAGSVGPVLATVFLASLAACGFGMLLGMACTSYEQASALGSTAVVAAAAIGGVMVPVYAMPAGMRRLSLISPLNWGLTAFQDLLVRGYFFSAVWDDLGRLLLFFLVTLFFAWRLARPRR